MSWFARVRNVFRPDRLSSDLDREMAFHLAERADELAAGGMRRDDARREARRRFGNYGMQKENTRDRDVVGWIDTLIGDLRYAFRALRAAPGFATVAILSLALGIGANTAIFSLINAVMLRSLPVSRPQELMVVTRDGSSTLTNPIWEYLREHEDVFSGAFAYSEASFDLARGGEARVVSGAVVSGAFFTTLGVRPVVGRTLLPADDVRGCAPVAAISAAFWEGEYAADPAAIGRTVALAGHPFQIVGVIDPAFTGLDVGQHAQIYVPLCAQSVLEGGDGWIDARSRWYLHVVGRLTDMPASRAGARLDLLAPGLVAATLPPNWPAEARARYEKMRLQVKTAATGFSYLRATFRQALLVLMAIVGIVLLISCANVANLLLARATARQREIAVRLALGAGRARIARQLLTESVLLSLVSAVAGVCFAVWGSRLLVRLMSTSSNAVALDLSLDLRVLAFTVCVAMATGILFGLVPAWRSGRVDPHVAMKAQGRGVAVGHSRFGMGKALVVAQIALSLVLVVGAGLLLGSWRRLTTADPGFTAERVLLVSVDVLAATATPPERALQREQILERVRALPGVARAAASELTPIGRGQWNNNIKADGGAVASAPVELVWMNEVSDGYFAAIGTPFVAGRDFMASDGPASRPVAIVNEALARRVFGAQPAVGRRFRVEEGATYGQPIEIVGIVGNTKYRSMRDTDEPIAYFAMRQDSAPGARFNIEVRADRAADAVGPAIKAAIADVAPRASLTFIPLERQVSESLRLPRTLATLSGFFGGLALLLAMIGLYGIMAYTVARRRNEFGVRIALGAPQGRVVRMVLGEVGRMVIAGVAAGILVALGVTRLVSAFLYGVTPSDPGTVLLSATALAVVAIAAAAIPAWRAARLDPVAALRED